MMLEINNETKKFKDFQVKENIVVGGSSVKKYLLIKENKKYMLRVFDARFQTSREIAYNNIQLLSEAGINVPRHIEYGSCNNDSCVYMIVDWLEGKSLDLVLQSEQADVKYSYGYKVGQAFRLFHNVRNDKVDFSMDNHNKKLSKLKLKLTKLVLNDMVEVRRIIEYLSSFSALKHCDSSIIHGDVHPGNIIITPEGDTYFIDLDMVRLGDSWSDLASNSCLLTDNEFYIGLINGYFKDQVPKEFWKSYIYYGCLYCIDYMFYSIRTEGMNIDDGLVALRKFLINTNNLNNGIPNFYSENPVAKYIGGGKR